MSKEKRKITGWHRYLTAEIGIELKACLYFFAIVFFYSLYRIISGCWEANIIHLAEMIASTYVIGYIQVYLLSNFDEADQFTGRVFGYSIVCTIMYTVISVACEWFDRKVSITIYFSFYVLFMYICAFWIYKLKRDIDTRMLNEELQALKEGRAKHGTRN